LLNVPAETLRYLTDKEQVIFEPSWSTDGLRLAYTTLAAREQASGSGPELEALLGGRVIAFYDMRSGVTQTLTDTSGEG
jgi:Tol biopolymer transport system component